MFINKLHNNFIKNLFDLKSISETSCQRSYISLFVFILSIYIYIYIYMYIYLCIYVYIYYIYIYIYIYIYRYSGEKTKNTFLKNISTYCLLQFY